MPDRDTAHDESEWLAALQRGDAGAFERLFRRYYAPLCDRANGYVQSRATAEELVQDVLLRLWRQRPLIVATSSLSGYLSRSVRNAALDHLKHARLEQRWQQRVAMGGEPVAPAADAGMKTGRACRPTR